MVDRKTELKSAVAKEALSELIRLAGVEKSRADDRISSNTKLKEIDREMLLYNVAKIYFDMVCSAYVTANEIEVQNLQFQVGLEQMCAHMEDI